MFLARGKKAGAGLVETSATSSTASPATAKVTGARRVRGLLPRLVVAMPTTRVSKAGGRSHRRTTARNCRKDVPESSVGRLRRYLCDPTLVLRQPMRLARLPSWRSRTACSAGFEPAGQTSNNIARCARGATSLGTCGSPDLGGSGKGSSWHAHIRVLEHQGRRIVHRHESGRELQ